MWPIKLNYRHMKAFNKKEKVRQIFLEFKKYDKLHHRFLSDFENGIYNFIADHPESIHLQESFPEDLKSFSYSLISCAYEVIEKDTTYPDYRMEMELENMERLLQNYPVPQDNAIFSEGFSMMSKAKMPKYFPQLYDLSANGFRLLERCTSYRINAFLMYLYGK